MAGKKQKRLLTNSFFNVVAFANNVLIGVLIVPFLVRHLGDSTYGVWALISSVLAYSMLLTLSLNSGVDRWIPMMLTRRDFDGINSVVSTVLVSYLVSTIVLAVGVVVVIYGFPHWFNIPSGMEHPSRVAVAVVGLGFMSLVQLSVFSGVLSGLERYDLFAATELSKSFIQIAGIIAVVLSGGGLIELAIVYAGANVVKSVLSVVFAFRACPELKPRRSLASRELFVEMLAYSFNSFLYSFQMVAQRQMSLVVIGMFLTASDVTYYAMPTILVLFLIELITQLTRVLKPAVSRMDAGGETERVRSVYLSSSKLALMTAIALASVLFLYGDRVLMLWLGEAYVPGQEAILAVLIVAAIFQSWARPAFSVVVGMGRHQLFGRAAIAQIAISTAVACIGLKWGGWGTLGVAYAFAVPAVLIVVLVLVPFSSHTVGLPLSRLITRCVLPALLANAPVVAALLLLESTLRHFQGMTFVAATAAVGLLFLVGAWLLGLTRDEKQALLRLARLA